ncbi:MAG: shikimate kinase [Lachnospiraceae bacterium]|nr:shikimate kinase [Lachnospiraceae bacterium]
MIKDNPNNNIVLIGFMGSGKSTVGKYIAKEHPSNIAGDKTYNFIDTDEYIVQTQGMPITEIFATKGEEYFRELETKTLKYFKDNCKDTVFSTGGGMPLRTENAHVLKEIGVVVYLRATADTIYGRVKDDTGRPLLQVDDPYERICELLTEREAKYMAAADKIVDTDGKSLEDIVNYIFDL